MCIVFNMSSMTTPTRPRPPIVLPGIDTRAHLDGKATMLTYSGLPTPPQSALESRRPSIQYSALADGPYSAVSSSATFSQPATPIRTLGRQDSLSQPWLDHVSSATNTPTATLQAAYTATNGFHQHFHSPYQTQPPFQTSGLDGNGLYGDDSAVYQGQFGPPINSSSEGLWSPSQPQHTANTQCASSLGPTLFAMSQGLHAEDQPTESPGWGTQGIYQEPQSAAHTAGHVSQYGGPVSSGYVQPQLIVPSQLSPHEEYAQELYHATPSPAHAMTGYSTSFGSSNDSVNGFELVRAPSPIDAYFAHSDEEDFTHVKYERAGSPPYRASLRRCSTSGTRRRNTKRSRPSLPGIVHRHVVGNTEVFCDFDPVNGPRVKTVEKQHKCTHLKPNGELCGVAFDRSEHLKRHLGSHSDEKHYPCPLPDCRKEIQRPDNAGDHFKTHLRPKKKGKRNNHVPWPILRNAIWTTYSDKKRAKKLLDNLEKWVEAGMPESPGNCRRSSCDGRTSIKAER